MMKTDNNLSQEKQVIFDRITKDFSESMEKLGISKESNMMYNDLDNILVRTYIAICFYLGIPVEFSSLENMNFPEQFENDPVVILYQDFKIHRGEGNLNCTPGEHYPMYKEVTDIFSLMIHQVISEQVESNLERYELNDYSKDEVDSHAEDDVAEYLEENFKDRTFKETDPEYVDALNKCRHPYKLEFVMNIFNALIQPSYEVRMNEVEESVIT